MKSIASSLVLLALLLAPLGLKAEFWGYDGLRNQFLDQVWDVPLGEFQAADYDNAVNLLFGLFETTTGKRLEPGDRGRAGLKIYTNSGAGLATPRPLVDAVIEELVARGFERGDLLIVDAREIFLRDAGYLPLLSARAESLNYNGVPVLPLDSGEAYSSVWFYESNLPSQAGRLFPDFDASVLSGEEDPDARRSYLASPLITDVDFWINLPVVADSSAVGVSGALTNATLWNISNSERFFASPANAPVAVAEIAAIPEITSGMAFTIMSLERYQVIGGPIFNSYYTRSEPRLWMSVNPVVLDHAILRRMNAARVEERLPPLQENLTVLRNAELLGLGERQPPNLIWTRLP